MSKSYDDYEGQLESGVRAAIARIAGEWDQPDLVAFGPLGESTLDDVWQILRRCLDDSNER